MRDIIYLSVYIIGFFVITKAFNDYVGFLIYFVFIMALALGCYKKELINYGVSALKR